MQREDGASMFRFDVATGKAWAAVGMGASSRALAARAKDNPNFFITLAATATGKFLPQIGGVLIRDASGNIFGCRRRQRRHRRGRRGRLRLRHRAGGPRRRREAVEATHRTLGKIGALDRVGRFGDADAGVG